ncbi:MAG: arylsulfatase A-like enzyme [Verrucomicrobiales bacterium]|jgi:arylsulfatase A-like enzyme
MKSPILPILASLLFWLNASQAAGKPNFVFILADDYGIMDVGIEGSSFYETPNLDKLAKSGMRFTQGYATCQVCSPSRVSIMTGKYPARHGVTDWIGAASGTNWKRNDRVLPTEYVHALPAEDTTLAEAMKATGYKTFFAGKWHMGSDKNSLPTDHGFDINIGGGHVGSPYNGFFSPYKNPRLKDGPRGESLPIRLGQETAKFIEAHKEEPFFAYLSFYSVHGPIQTSEELWLKYQKKAKGGAGMDKRFIFDRTKGVRQVQDNPIYAGMVESMDSAIGVVLDKLRALGLDENTVVIFTSDNGGVSSGDAFSTSNLPYRGGKGRQWEGGIREPYYVRAPGVTKPGTTTPIPVTGTDFYPTILELAGLPAMPAQHVDGVSLVPVLKGGKIPDRDLFWHYPHYGNQGGEPSSVIRSGDYKLIRYYEDGREELYRLSKDIGEQSDLASQESGKVSALSQKLDKWLNETGARIPQADVRFNAEKKKGQIENATTKGIERLEKQHANFLKPDFKPNATWWDSKATKD